MKQYYIQCGFGKTRYAVNFHDGIQTHKDGSPFFDMKLFSNKKELSRFVRELKRNGYCERSNF